MTHSAPNVLERFLRYVQFDTQSDETSAAAPSTAKQLKLAEALKDELHQLGIANAVHHKYDVFVNRFLESKAANADWPSLLPCEPDKEEHHREAVCCAPRRQTSGDELAVHCMESITPRGLAQSAGLEQIPSTALH